MSTIQVVIMQETEARLLVNEIKAGITAVGDKLLELYDREGWKALGYDSWRACCTAEFSFSQSRVYQLLTHAKTAKNIADSTYVEKPLTEAQTRPLSDLDPSSQVAVYQSAVVKAGNKPPTGPQVAQEAKVFKSLDKKDQVRMPPKTKTSSGYSGSDNQSTSSNDMSQTTGIDEDMDQTGERANRQPTKTVKGFTLEELLVMLGEFDDGKTCPYCGK